MIYADKQREESPFVSVNNLIQPRKEYTGISTVPPYLTQKQEAEDPALLGKNDEVLSPKNSDSDQKFLEGIGDSTEKVTVDRDKYSPQKVENNEVAGKNSSDNTLSTGFQLFLAEIFDDVIRNNLPQTAFMNFLNGRGFKTNAQYYLNKRDEMAEKAGGSSVAVAQASLVCAGYDLGKYGVDGIKGKENSYTTKAIKEFQLATGLSPTGNIDEQTMFVLNIIIQTGMKKMDIEELGAVLGHYSLVWPTESQIITSSFGWRTHPITGEQRSYHGGIDIGPVTAGSEGDKIVAALSGRVINSAYQYDVQTKKGAGFYLTIESIYKGRKVHIYYMHLQKDSLVVKKGDFVNAGQHIANMGRTGGATGPHLHYEIRVFKDGKWVKEDPMSWNYKSNKLKQPE